MKSIDQISKEVAEQVMFNERHINFVEMGKDIAKRAIEISQRFIPVEEELPPKEEEDSDESIIVLIQETQDLGNVFLGWYDYYQEKWFMVYRLHEVKPTHWRPIYFL